MSAPFGDLAANHGFSGVVLVNRGDETLVSEAYGYAHLAHGVENTIDTRFAIASGTKGFTALVVIGLIAEGRLALSTTAREVLGDDLPLIDDRVTVEHLLTHTSGIGDYCDEEADPPPPPTPLLATSADYLAALDGYPQVSPPGTEFRYHNGAFAVLGLIAERIARIPFADLVRLRVTEPAGMTDTAFLRSDALPARTATGYLEDGRTNVFSLPVVGFADGGIYSSAPDFRKFWPALLDGRIVPREWVARMLRPHAAGYGLGFWLPRPGVVHLDGGDHGVTFWSTHEPASGLTATLISNNHRGGGPLLRWLDEFLTKA
ncbi:beta-lactamase class C [Amycolatopsis mediterranei S699]|uniref:Beta-lactamase class C n=3 Tax=Amycolatopsis mediterranei TaxID=33910 RepID=A0A0H3DKN3_AMYMU|nr:serine hydrolase domain-containing protein [Amycolatopsis mediterranei]ADJ50777.1 beta-lactamase class C [Amycolatopsis mediterranei U32]AEK47787.1 beta-lactamase class C [Amycolatopsis mediterranei S699]AFO82483.1 beta-lactamase class C [Amycolatopsis mediterranei S699]AGT89612.1 beta-lactamase class C [Amycolatopsis mediterranei RB]KDO12230.1 beta-lactamase [Amycolatopsis mediterranei]